METKIGTSIQIRSSFSGGKGISVQSVQKNINANSAETTKKTNSDTFSMSSQPVEDNLSKEKMDELKKIKNAKRMEPLNLNWEKDDYASNAKFNFDILSSKLKGSNEKLSENLKTAGVPSDVTFEFNYNIDSGDIEITQISDEKYRKSIESVFDITKNHYSGIYFTAFASRVMNGYISSMFYPRAANSLKICFEQDISDLYIDENGNLCGANESLQEALKSSDNGIEFNSNQNQNYHFPAKDIEGIIKRLISDKNITTNISHMGYDGEKIYTDDGEFKFGKNFDTNLFNEEKYVMRGAISLAYTFSDNYDLWLTNEKMFN